MLNKTLALFFVLTVTTVLIVWGMSKVPQSELNDIGLLAFFMAVIGVPTALIGIVIADERGWDIHMAGLVCCILAWALMSARLEIVPAYVEIGGFVLMLFGLACSLKFHVKPAEHFWVSILALAPVFAAAWWASHRVGSLSLLESAEPIVGVLFASGLGAWVAQNFGVSEAAEVKSA